MDAFRPLDCWSYNTLHRTRVIGQKTLQRACQRKIEWPRPEPPQLVPVQNREEEFAHTSLDEAFARIQQSMSETTRQCKRYYRSNPPTGNQMIEQQHCHRFHSSRTRSIKTEPKTSVHVQPVEKEVYTSTSSTQRWCC